MPSADALPQLSEAYTENSRWLMDHLAEIVREHPNQWVAVHGGQILAADPDLGVVTAATAQVPSPSDTVFHFVDDGLRLFVSLPEDMAFLEAH